MSNCKCQHHTHLRKVAEAKPPCRDQAHNPPGYLSMQPGQYEYTCPRCKHVTKFTVPLVTC